MRVLLAADKFADENRSAGERHPGGAELTDEVAIAACPWPITALAVRDLSAADTAAYDLIVASNLADAPAALVQALSEHPRCVLFEHDVRICRWRGNFPASNDPVHKLAQFCWCAHNELASLTQNALGCIFLTERQRRVYRKNPFFEARRESVLGCSLFGDEFFRRVEQQRGRGARPRHGSAVLYSPNAIKGTRVALHYCESRGLDAMEIRDLSPEQVLDRLAESERLVYLPVGLEPAGRMPVEARALGCEVVVNANLGIGGEAWWKLDGSEALDHVRAAPERFWSIVRKMADEPTREPSKHSARTLRRRAEKISHVSELFCGPLLPRGATRHQVRRALVTETYAAWP